MYADKIANLIPENIKLSKMIPFVPTDKEIGNKYHQPVILSHELGFTFQAANGTAFSLNNQIASGMADAQCEGSQILLRSAISYEAAARASTNVKAFTKWTEHLVTNMVNSMAKMKEIECFYGQQGIGQPSAVSGSSTNRGLTISTAKWATGIWAGFKGGLVDIYQSTTQLNTNAAVAVTAVDLVNKLISVSGNSTDLTNLDNAAGSGTVDIYFYGAYANETAGIDKIITNTGSLYNIDASSYELWKGNSYSASSAALSMGKILAGLGQGPIGKGLEEDVDVFVSPPTWANLATDIAALRRFDGSYSSQEADSGTEALTYYGQNGKIRIHSSIYVKWGEAFAVPTKQFIIGGATDMTFRMPGKGELELFLQLPSNAGYELRNYIDFFVFCRTPGKTLKFTSITNT